MFVVILVVSILLYVLFVLPRSHTFWLKRGVPQGKPWIFFGDSWGTIFGKMTMAETVSYTYNLIPNTRYYGIYQFSKPKLVIRDPELIRRVTVRDFDHFVDHVAMVDPKADPLFAKNLISLRGDEWRKMRSTLSGSFTSSKMKMMFPLMTEAAKGFTDFFRKREGRIVEVELKDAFTRFTIDAIASTSFGATVNSLREPENEFFKMGMEIAELNFKTVLKILVFQFSPKLYRLLGLKVFRKELNEFFTKLIKDAITLRRAEGVYRPDMLQILMESPDKDMSIEDITAQAMIFFFAGFDSVSSTMTFAAYELAVNGNVQDKLREEVRATIDQCHGEPTFEAINGMKYMEMVITETLRKWPPFVIAGRECTRTYTIEPAAPSETTLVVPKGMGVQIPAYAIHYDPKYYPEPQKFLPERFSAENRDNLTPYTFLGFGQGPRACIGSRFAMLEIKIVLFHLIRNFRLLVTEKTQVPLKLSRRFSINIKPEKGLSLGLEKL